MKDEFTFDEVKHVYKLNGERMTGVTTILGVIAAPGLIQWAANEAVKYIKVQAGFSEDYNPETVKMLQVTTITLEAARTAHARKRDKAADIGTITHKEVETLIKENRIRHSYSHSDPKVEMMVNEFRMWAIANDVEFLESEEQVYHKELFYAGTFDFLCKIGEKVYLGDLKTSSGIYNSMFYQTAAYEHALHDRNRREEKPELKIDGHIIVNVKKTGGIDVRVSYRNEKNLEAFLAALTLYRREAEQTRGDNETKALGGIINNYNIKATQ